MKGLLGQPYLGNEFQGEGEKDNMRLAIHCSSEKNGNLSLRKKIEEKREEKWKRLHNMEEVPTIILKILHI